MTRAILLAAAIVTLAVPVVIVVTNLYCMIAGIDNPQLAKWGDLSLGFVFASLASRVWDSLKAA